MNNKQKDLVLLFVLVTIAVTTRTIFYLGPNIEFVTAVCLASGFIFARRKIKLYTPLLALAISDLIIGNTPIFLFTWSAFLLTPFIGSFIKNIQLSFKTKQLPKFINTIIVSEVGGIISVLFFFFWTNLGVVIVSDLYPKTMAGLIQSYVNALPFLYAQLLSNLLIVPFIVLAAQRFYNHLGNEQVASKENMHS